MNEEWRAVKDFEEFYQVSNLGRIRRSGGGQGAVVGRILRPVANRWGYLAVSLQKNGIKKTCRIHREVALAFIPNPTGLREVNHINGDKNDNRAANLEWCTRGENQSHSYQIGLRYSGGEANHEAKLTWEDVKDIRSRYVPGQIRQVDLATEYGVTQTTISRIILHKDWRTRV